MIKNVFAGIGVLCVLAIITPPILNHAFNPCRELVYDQLSLNSAEISCSTYKMRLALDKIAKKTPSQDEKAELNCYCAQRAVF
jgi:hypothetical protein